MTRQWQTIGILAISQIVTWGSLYYAFGILAPAIARDTGWGPTTVFGAFSWSLLVAGLVATPAGILLDRHGGRLVMGAGSVVCAIGFFLLSESRSASAYVLAWTVLGLAMGLTLYEAAFATINRKFGADARVAISNLTLLAGFSSTIFWPLSQAAGAALGWRATYLCFGVAQLLVCLPLHLMLGADAPRAAAPAHVARRSHTLAEALRHPAFWALALAFAANIFVFSALSVHLIPLLQEMGHSARAAILVAMLVGPMQVAGRVLERTAGRQAAPRHIGKFCFGALPAALAVLLLCGTQAWAMACFAILYGLSNGVITIVRGTLPQAMFGTAHYGAISGAMAGPSLLAKAAAPLLAAWVLKQGGTPDLLLASLAAVALMSVAFYFVAIARETAPPGAHPAA